MTRLYQGYSLTEEGASRWVDAGTEEEEEVVLRDSRSTSLLRLIGVARRREKGIIVRLPGRSLLRSRHVGDVLASRPLKTKLGEFRLVLPVSTGLLSPAGDASASSEPPGRHVVAGNRLDARKTLQLRRRSVSLHGDRRRAARHHALLGGRRRQRYHADNTCKSTARRVMSVSLLPLAS